MPRAFEENVSRVMVQACGHCVHAGCEMQWRRGGHGNECMICRAESQPLLQTFRLIPYPFEVETDDSSEDDGIQHGVVFNGVVGLNQLRGGGCGGKGQHKGKEPRDDEDSVESASSDPEVGFAVNAGDGVTGCDRRSLGWGDTFSGGKGKVERVGGGGTLPSASSAEPGSRSQPGDAEGVEGGAGYTDEWGITFGADGLITHELHDDHKIVQQMERLELDDEVRMMSKEDTIREAGVLIQALETYKLRLETLLPEHVAELREEYFEKLGMDPSFSRVAGSEMQFAGRKRKGGDDGGNDSKMTKSERRDCLKEELAAQIVRLHMQGQAQVLPQWATHIAAANAVMAGGGVGALIAGKPRAVATDLIGAVSGTAVGTRYKALSELLYPTEIAMSNEMKKQMETTMRMMVTATELAFVNEFADKFGTVSWANFTKAVADALGQPQAAGA